MFNTKKFFISMLILAGLYVIVMFLITWYYPFSSFSLYKSYTYKPDPIMVQGYVRELNDFKSSYEKDYENMSTETPMNYTVNQTQTILHLFEQDWIVSGKPVNFTKTDLDNILNQVIHVRHSLFNLIERENYTYEQRQYLVGSIESLLHLEDSIRKIQIGNLESRKTIQTQFHNLHGSFMASFMMFESFYELTIKESLEP